ncbi:MAG: DUF1648 domain-containing protein [Chryseolinea sp.]
MIQTTMSKMDWFLESLSITGLLAIVGLISYSYDALPTNIPTHFDASGRPDALNGKGSLLIIAIVAIFVYTIMTIAPYFPHGMNYPFQITPENAERQHRNMITMTRVVKPLIVLVSLYLTFAVIQNGLGKMNGLSPWFIPVEMMILLGVIAFFFIRAFKLK